ncbi:RNA 2',3'-cyclic phosphodiesterase [Sinimarinibacterium flocculans]|uniref:RNA 2',3'-cyclic phosphodiesterase n=1 Tax=Sinimarinibacterium flocculans TaxID=985250 RepID=A0A318EH65_9GAMM|nr:RNA 2',3'-cyclic phosphodiesterase [Sinimarinibacterium flocculans]PXV71568.1 2'-5' RNA ligase [Sinimarinibacterium flocculans]
MAGRRLFIALMPDAKVRGQLHATAKDLAIRMNPQRRRMIAPENYHVTLQFLGDGITDEQLAALRQALSLVRGDPVEMTIDHARTFGEGGTWWLGMRQTPPALDALRAQVLLRTGSVGFTGDRRFTPHVSVMKVPEKLPPTRTMVVTWTADTFALVSSTLTPDGSRYEVLQQWLLKGGAAASSTEQLSLL